MTISKQLTESTLIKHASFKSKEFQFSMQACVGRNWVHDRPLLSGIQTAYRILN